MPKRWLCVNLIVTPRIYKNGGAIHLFTTQRSHFADGGATPKSLRPLPCIDIH
jgi:hypothetical protein